MILGTLVGQGLTMPLVIRALGLEDDGVGEREAVKARIHAADAALNRIDELSDEDWVREDTAERLRRLYRFRRNRFAERYTGDGDGAIEERSAAYQQLLRELIEAERQAVVELRGPGRSATTRCGRCTGSWIWRRPGSICDGVVATTTTGSHLSGSRVDWFRWAPCDPDYRWPSSATRWSVAAAAWSARR